MDTLASTAVFLVVDCVLLLLALTRYYGSAVQNGNTPGNYTIMAGYRPI